VKITETQALAGAEDFGHKARVRALAFSPDDRFLATASDDHRAYVWDVKTKQQQACLVHDEPVSAVQFSPDQKLLLTATGFAGHPGVTIVWETENWKKVGTIDQVSISKFCTGVQPVFSARADRVVLTDTATGSVVLELPHDQTVTAFEVHPRGPIVGVITFDEQLWLWEQADQGRISRDLIGSSVSRISPVVFSPDGRKMAAVGTDSQIRVWDVASRREGVRVMHKGLGIQLVFDPTVRLLASLSPEHQSVCVWDVDTGRPVLSIEQPQASAVCFSTDGKWLATASDRDAAWIWAPPTGGGWTWSIVLGLSLSLRFSPDGQFLAWTGTRIAPDGRVVTKETGGTLMLLESATGHVVWSFQHETPIDNVGFSSDGQLIATLADKAVRVWEAATGRERPEQYSEAQNWFAERGHPVPEYPQATLSPDGKLFVSVSPGSTGVERQAEIAQVRETADDHRMVSELRFDGALTSVAWSPDGQSLASGHVDGVIRLWQASTGREIARLDHHIDVVPALAFSPNGQWLASAGYDTSVRMWRPRHEDLITEASSRLTRNLTPEEWQHYLGEEEYRQTCTRLAAAATD
jgi:WD40 repeat protein